MNGLIEYYRWLDMLQRTRWFRIAATIVAVLACVGIFGSLLVTAYSLDAQRQTLLPLLESQNLERRDPHAVTLRDSASLTVNNRTYTSEYFVHNPEWIFDERGNVAAPPFLVDDLLRGQIPAWLPESLKWLLDQPGTTWLLAGVVTTWFLLIIWMAISVPLGLTVLATAVPVFIAWMFNAQQMMLALAGIGLLTFTYVLLTRTALLLYERPNQVLAVAHTVIKEASRSRISLVFIVLLLVALPLIPVWLDPEAPLRFRIQTFISRSMNLTFVLAACMTLFLACSTVAFEIRDRQIWQLMTKPMNRLSYIVGKWLGVVTVNLILLIISGVAAFTFIQYLRTLPVAPGVEGQLDRVQVDSEILTARVSARPAYPTLTDEQIEQRIEEIIARDPDLVAEQVTSAQRREWAEDIIFNFAAMQRSVPPMQVRDYVFEGLADAKRMDSDLTLRYRFFILRDDQHETFPAAFVLNHNPDTFREVRYVPTMRHVQWLSPEHVTPEGTLTVSLANLFDPPPDMGGRGSINFEEDGFEVLYKVANFEGNFLRAVLVAWTKLAFLAMLGICCATFLSFPVAALFSFTIFIAGAMGPFLAMSLELYAPRHHTRVDWSNVGMVIEWGFQWVVRLIAEGLVVALRAFGEYSSTQNLVEGRFIPWSDVAVGFLILGVFWSGAALLVGYLVIRSRQLAIYSGQG